MSGRVWPAEVVSAAYPVLDSLLRDLDACALRRDVEGAIREMLDAAADALAVDAEGEVVPLPTFVRVATSLQVQRDNYRARADAAEARLAEVLEGLTEAIRFSVEYVGTDTLRPIEGWSWFDALMKYAPEKAQRFIDRPVIESDSTEAVTPADEAVES